MPEVAIEWLRKEKEKAWDEGYRAANANSSGNSNIRCTNPYRKEPKEDTWPDEDLNKLPSVIDYYSESGK